MSDLWQQFIDDVPWFLQDARVREVRDAPRGSWRPRSREFSDLFPALTDLLGSSFVTHVSTDDRTYVLHSWEDEDGSARSWLCPPAHDRVSLDVYPAHRILLESFGGVVERANELPRGC